MKVFRVVCLVALVGLAVMAGSTVSAEERTVPSTLASISDSRLRDAITSHSPNYDELGRGSQIFTYVHVYHWLNNSATPDLTPDDAALLSALDNQVPSVTHSLEVPVQHLNTAPGISDSAISGPPDWFDDPVIDAERVQLEPVIY